MEEKKMINIDPEILRIIGPYMEEGVNRGIQIAVKQIIDSKEECAKARYDRKIRNTNLLLKNYKRFKEHIKNTVCTEEELETATVTDILDSLYNLEDDEKDDITIVQGILKSKKRTEIILKHIDKIINFYMYDAESTNDIELKRRADVIYKLYIEGKNLEEITDELHISISTAKRDRKRATNEIAILMFGIDGIRFD